METLSIPCTPKSPGSCYLRLAPIESVSLAVWSCLTPASPRGYLYAGLEFGAECYCGHKIQAANVSEAECDMDCKGERGSVCGGVNRLSVYRLQLAQESARRCT